MSAYLFYFFIALLVNIPAGWMMGKSQKFSLKWLGWAYASMPLLVYLQLSMKINNYIAPLAIFPAVLGQGIGVRMYKKQMTQEDKDKYNRIGDLNTHVETDPAANDQNVSIVLMNMGGPKTNADVKPFLYRLFLDPMILRFPLSQYYQPLFAWLIVTLRGKNTEERYRLIGGGSPIFDSTEKQATALKNELAKRGRNIDVTFSFNYSEPLPETTIKELKDKNKDFAMVLSLYPHYSLATTGSNMFYLGQAAKKDFPTLKFLKTPSYHLHQEYIQGFKDRISEQVKPGESLDDFYLLFSAHGLPLYFVLEGDPYAYQISQSVSAILSEFKRTDSWSISYQSAVGPLQWLKPSTENVLESLAQRGVKKLIVVPISFVTDHIETLAEIDIEYRAVAEKAGITDFRMAKALECHPGLITALADTVEKTLPHSFTVIATAGSPCGTKGSHEAIRLS